MEGNTEKEKIIRIQEEQGEKSLCLSLYNKYNVKKAMEVWHDRNGKIQEKSEGERF